MSRAAFICPNCGHQGEPRKVTRGSFLIEVLLWCMLLLPGLIYSIWRLTTRHRACRSCGQPGVIPVTSPVGRRLVAEYGAPQRDK